MFRSTNNEPVYNNPFLVVLITYFLKNRENVAALNERDFQIFFDKTCYKPIPNKDELDELDELYKNYNNGLFYYNELHMDYKNELLYYDLHSNQKNFTIEQTFSKFAEIYNEIKDKKTKSELMIIEKIATEFNREQNSAEQLFVEPTIVVDEEHKLRVELDRLLQSIVESRLPPVVDKSIHYDGDFIAKKLHISIEKLIETIIKTEQFKKLNYSNHSQVIEKLYENLIKYYKECQTSTYKNPNQLLIYLNKCYCEKFNGVINKANIQFETLELHVRLLVESYLENKKNTVIPQPSKRMKIFDINSDKTYSFFSDNFNITSSQTLFKIIRNLYDDLEQRGSTKEGSISKISCAFFDWHKEYPYGMPINIEGIKEMIHAQPTSANESSRVNSFNPFPGHSKFGKK